ncbi:hypothetical protein RS030_71026 [Cryptosporidium xiaoi]|uniref:Uncharacterized protein n=1 Tax=Cryptosporidium xiaoi TaxID=659607 RepID=A0AAV9XTN8_9CRYT
MKRNVFFMRDDLIFPLIKNNVVEYKCEIPCFFIDNNENILFSLACNYFSLGQFELGRSVIIQLASIESKKAHMLLKHIILNGQPPEWQLSPSIPSSAHLIFACIKEFRFLTENIDFENDPRNELDLLLTQLILGGSFTHTDYNNIREIRLFYNIFFNLFKQDTSKEYFFIHELKFIPKIMCIPSYLSRIPSYSIKSVYFFDELGVKFRDALSLKNLISGLLSYSISSPKIFGHISKHLMMEDCIVLDIENISVGIKNTFISSLKSIRTSIQWIIIKSCFSVIINYIEKSIPIYLLKDNFHKLLCELKLKFLFSCDKANNNERNDQPDEEYLVLCEKSLLFIFSFYSLLNFFIKHNLCEQILIRYLKNNFELLKRYENICYDNSFCPNMLGFKGMKKTIFYRDDFLFMGIWENIINGERLINNSLDCFGEFLNSNSKEISLFNIILENDISLTREYFGFDSPFGIISLTKFNRKELNETFFERFFNEKIFDYEILENGPLYWCEFLNYLKVIKHRYEEAPVSFAMKILSKETYEKCSFDLIGKLNTLFPSFRPLNIFLGLKEDPIFNWKLIKNLWLPFRLGKVQASFSNENELLVNKLDEISRQLIISILVARGLRLNYLENDKLFENTTKVIFRRIVRSKSIIRCCIDTINENKDAEGFKWRFIEGFVSGITSLPITNGMGAELLTQERDCLKSYLIFEEFYSIFKKGNSIVGSRMQNISIELGGLCSRKFHEELIYSCYCLILISFEELVIKISMKDGSFFPNSFSFIFYYLFIWCNRLSVTNELRMLKIITNIFEKYLSFVEFVLYSIPIKAPNYSSDNNEIQIFTWWYKDIIHIPIKAFKAGESLICMQNFSHSLCIEDERVKLRKVYRSSPWYSCLLEFELINCIETINYSSIEHVKYINNIISSSINIVRLLHIQNYEKAFSLIFDNTNVKKEVKYLTLDEIIFQVLIKKISTVARIHIFLSLIRAISERIDHQYVKLGEHLTILELMDSIVFILKNVVISPKNDIGFLIKFTPDLYYLCITIDYYISAGSKSDENSQALHKINEKIVNYELKAIKYLEKTVIRVIRKTFNKLNIFFKSGKPTSLNKYILEIDISPQQDSHIKSHLDYISSRKIITTNLTQSICCLVETSKNKSEAPRNFGNISNIINQSLNTFENYGNINYLYSVLLYVKEILNLIGFSEDIEFIPILALEPIEIISYSFFHKNINGSEKLSTLMNENFLHMIIKSINNLKLGDDPNNISTGDLELFYSSFVNNSVSFGLIVHNILPILNVDFGFKIWKFALYKIDGSGYINNTQIMRNLMDHRINKYKILKINREKISSSNYSDVFVGIECLIFSCYHNNFDKWLNLVDVLHNINLNDIYVSETLIGKIEIGSDLLSLNSSINIVVFLLLYHLSRKIIGIGSCREICNIINSSRHINLTSFPFFVYNTVINFINELDPNSLLDLIDITLKNMAKINGSNIQYLNANIEFIRDNMFTIFSVIREFCIEYINSFSDTLIWDKWSKIIKNWSSTKGIVTIISFFIELKLFNLANFISDNLLFKVLKENGGEEYTKSILGKLFSEEDIIGEIKSVSNFEHNKFILEINNVISNLRDCYLLEKSGFKLINPLFSRKIQNFETVAKLFNKMINTEEKYMFVEALIASQSLTSDINRMNILKTISLSLRLLKELNLKKIRNIYLYSPYLILRIGVLERNCKILEFLEREIDIFFKSDRILLNIIEESFGINIDEFSLKEKIRTSAIFGQANPYNCFKLFPIVSEEEFTVGFEPLIKLNNNDICFNIKLLSLLPKNESTFNFVFKIADELSARLNIFFKKYISFYSLVKHNFRDSFIWIKEEGALGANTSNLHPFSRLKNLRQNKFTNYNLFDNYKGKKYLTEKYFGTIYKKNSKSALNNTSNSLSILRLYFKNIIKLLRWGEQNFRSLNFSIMINTLPLLFELWFRLPGISISLKDIMSPKYDTLCHIISIDQVDLGRSILNLNIIFSKSGERKSHELDNKFLSVRNLIYNSIVFSNMSLNLNNLHFKPKYQNKITGTTSKSRNKMILEIFFNKWKVSEFKNVDIEIFNDNTVNLIEHSFLSRFGILNSLIIKIFLTSISWIIRINNNGKNNKFKLPLDFAGIIKSDHDIVKLFEVYHNLFNLSKQIPRKQINIVDFLQKWLNIYTTSQVFESFFQGACKNQSLSTSVLALEQILSILKGNIFLTEDKPPKIHTGMLTLFDHSCFRKKISIHNKIFKYNMINQILLQNNQNHISIINSLVKLNLWWETMVYILRWSFELGHSKSRSLVNNDRSSRSTNKSVIASFDVLYCELVVKKAHSLNQLEDLIDSMNQALPYGGPRATITIRKCRQIIQKYLEHHGALEMLYMSIIYTALNHDVSHAIAGTIAVHLSLTNHVNFDARIGYLNLAFHHFTAADWSLRRRLKIGPTKKQSRAPNLTSNLQIIEHEYTHNPFSKAYNSSNYARNMENILIDSIGDVQVNNLNTSPWGGLSQTSLQKIIRLIELQDSISFHLIRENSNLSILSPKYEDRRDTIIKLFLKNEFYFGFKACKILDVPLLEVLVYTTKCLIESHQTNRPLLRFIDSMKHWLPTDDVDALVSNAVNMWISEKRINLNLIEDGDKKSITELIDKFANTLSRREAYNMINPNESRNFLE